MRHKLNIDITYTPFIFCMDSNLIIAKTYRNNEYILMLCITDYGQAEYFVVDNDKKDTSLVSSL